MPIKSPFLIIEEAISPKQCEDIIYHLDNTEYSKTPDGMPQKTVRFNSLLDIRLESLVENIVEESEKYYNYSCEYVSKLMFEWFVPNYKQEPPKCENSVFLNGKWYKNKDNDFTVIIFLNDFQESPPFDPEYEVVGGKLEFPTHSFSFNPRRGEAIIFPSNSNFLNSTSKVLLGELNQIRIHLTAESPYLYNRDNFQGDYTKWFK